ncbi:MAG: MBL fold metallo-hydrolase [Chitinophagales bacterium]|nr:MBL fold metallo-hydrolase [Bacteroidota bacterium]
MKKEIKYNVNLPFIKDDKNGNLCIDGQYILNESKENPPYSKLFMWMVNKNPQRKEKKSDKFVPEVFKNNTFLNSTHDCITWLGHSSFYIQLQQIKILTDPVFYSLTPLLKRKHPLPCNISDFKDINYIILSHGHRDHLDIPTLKKLCKQNPKVEVLCPLGFEKMLQKIGFTKIQEAAWWQRYNTQSITIDFLPAKHWNRRFITDYNTTLWGSFALSIIDKKIYFAGDTAYDQHFKEIQEHYQNFDFCLMPIGAYKPRYVMKWAHISPEEAIQAFQELQGKTFIPMHYGTFDLSDEPASEPIRIIEKNMQLDGALKTLKVGEHFQI